MASITAFKRLFDSYKDIMEINSQESLLVVFRYMRYLNLYFAGLFRTLQIPQMLSPNISGTPVAEIYHVNNVECLQFL